MQNIKSIYSILFLSSVFFLSACNDKDKDPTKPAPINPKELITTIKLTLTDTANAANTFTVQWRDADGPGALPPVIDTLLLDAGKVYTASVKVLDETKTPVFDVTEEIEEEEADVHQFFYTLSSNLNGRVSINRLDTDVNGLPIGLDLLISTTSGAGVTGTLNVVLSHYDGIPKTTAPSPESDVDITFPVRVR
jgi:hypothetical protein